MTTFLRRSPLHAKGPTTAVDVDCTVARETKGLAAAFVRRPRRQQLAPLARLRLSITDEDLWQFRAELPRDFHTRDLLATAERLAQQIYDAAKSGGKGIKIRQR